MSETDEGCECITSEGTSIANWCALHNPITGTAVEHPVRMTGLLSVLRAAGIEDAE